ncbi:MAG: hypothetical protein KTR32_31850 [Granulosicoccus sp.]|nr:hypothetical protein [Granulosicoccus sp.]
MINRYINQLRGALSERSTAPLPNLTWIILIVVGGTIAYIGLAILAVPSGEPREFQFVSENGAVTALSALFLTTAAAFSLASMVTLWRAGASHTWVWLLMAVGFAFLSFDELLQFHERVGELLDQTSSSGKFRHWNDIIVILYGVIALPILFIILPGLMQWRLVMEMFAIAFLFYGLHTLVDSISVQPTSASIIVEESAKLLCGAFLAIAMFIGFIGVVWKHTTAPEH